MKNKDLRLLTLTAMFAALIMLVTAYIMHIPTGFNNGYIHLGDTMIYIAAAMLPTPYAFVAAAMGGRWRTSCPARPFGRSPRRSSRR